MQQTDRRPSLLLVEDSPADVFLVKQAMQEEGMDFRLDVMDDGEKAIVFIDNLDADCDAPGPSVILLDLNLPRQTGDDVLRRVRQSPKMGKTPVVIMTSSNESADRARMMELGANEYFRKPTDLQEFMRIGKLVRRMAGRSS